MSTDDDSDDSDDRDDRARTQRQAAEALREPLTPLDARRAEAESLLQVAEMSGGLMEQHRAGRLEAETRRISEEVTREAQQRLKAAQQPAPIPPTTGEHAAVAGRTVAASQIRHILVTLDGTPFAERAIPYATAVARATGASITLAHVAPPRPPHPLGILGGVVDSITSSAQHAELPDMHAYLTERRDRIAATGSVVAIELVEASSPSRALLEIAGRIEADLIVLASRVHEGLERRILGSVASDIVQHGNTPVLIVPLPVTAPLDLERSVARILVPLDGSLLAEQALGLAVGLLNMPPDLFSGPARELTLLYVADTQAAIEDGKGYMQAIRDTLEAVPLSADVTLRTYAVLGSPPGAIAASAAYGLPYEPAAPQPYDLLVMATHGRGGLSRWLFGSVAEYVLPRSTVPVLLVHPSQADL